MYGRGPIMASRRCSDRLFVKTWYVFMLLNVADFPLRAALS